MSDEEKVRQDDAQYRAITEDQRLLSRCGPDGSLSFVSDGFCRYFGRARDELLGRSLLAFVPDEDRALVRKHVESLGPTNPAGMLEHRVIVGDDEVRWHRRFDQAHLDAQDRVVEIESVARDITDQRRVAAELRNRDATIRAFFESAAEGIVGVDREGRIVLINARIESMFGYRQDELVGQRVEMLVPERSRAPHARERTEYFRRPRARPMGLGMSLMGRRKDGSEFPVEVSLSFVADDDGGVAMAFVTDISDRINKERQVRHVEKLAALGTLAAGIAHEINNPIGVILSRIELMLMEAGEQESPGLPVTDLEVLQRQAKRLSRIAQGLLSFGRHKRESRPVDLVEIVEDTLLIARKQLERDGIKIVTSLETGLARVLGDATALEQVLMNLLLNARDAMPEGGTIRIETSPAPAQPGAVQLVVADTGMGMVPEVLKRLWEPFFTTKASGTGLGLSVSSTIIREHGGAVRAVSEPGKGTTFTIVLPAMSKDAS
ncbi:MAG TPA: PAS domain S-box protein [Candidatus Methylomirabilis sp.]|nr:PAS domain S-box protein [Candidatus Methylomirabilis sp.]